jgi:YafQ family addiction module toxin component
MYDLLFTPTFEKQLKKIKSKDPVLLERITSKLEEISEKPDHFKPLKNVLKGCRRAHIDSFVIIFEISSDRVIVHSISHHDDAYR